MCIGDQIDMCGEAVFKAESLKPFVEITKIRGSIEAELVSL